MKLTEINIDQKIVSDFCQRHRIRKLSLFGSVLRGDFTPQSDLDILVEFEKGAVPGFAFASLQSELAVIFQRTVDLQTPRSLSKYFREPVVREALTIYETGKKRRGITR